MALPWAKTILERLKAELRPHGFRKNGGTFVRDVNGCIQFVNLQASQFGDSQRQKYTINLAVYGRGAAPNREAIRTPSYAEGQWRERIGRFTETGQDTWWTVRSDQDASAAAEAMVSFLPAALSAMEAVSSCETLRLLFPHRLGDTEGV